MNGLRADRNYKNMKEGTQRKIKMYVWLHLKLRNDRPKATRLSKSTWRMSDLYAHTRKLEINSLKMIVESTSACVCVCLYVCVCACLCLYRSVACYPMQYAWIFLQKYWWFGKYVLKSLNLFNSSSSSSYLISVTSYELPVTSC